MFLRITHESGDVTEVSVDQTRTLKITGPENEVVAAFGFERVTSISLEEGEPTADDPIDEPAADVPPALAESGVTSYSEMASLEDANASASAGGTTFTQTEGTPGGEVSDGSQTPSEPPAGDAEQTLEEAEATAIEIIDAVGAVLDGDNDEAKGAAVADARSQVVALAEAFPESQALKDAAEQLDAVDNSAEAADAASE